MTDDLLRPVYPFTATILKENPYRLEVGSRWAYAKRKEGDGSPFPVVVYDPKQNRVFQFTEQEVELREEGADG